MKKQPSILGGASIVASVCVGAGMLGLPAAGAGAWTIWTFVILFATMIVLIWAGWLLLEAYKNYDLTASYNTVTKDLLGEKVNIINNLAFYFLGGILLYAYTTALGNLFNGIFGQFVDFGEYGSRIWSIIAVAVFSMFVWHSTRLVDRFSTFLVTVMALSFILGVSGLTLKMDLGVLLNTIAGPEENTNYAVFAISLLPVAFTSFGYQHAASSIREYYGEEAKAAKAMLWGAVIALGLYIFWLVSVFGNLPRIDFLPVIAKGGSVEALLQAMGGVIESETIKNAVKIFSIAAILSSFVGVGLGVFHFFTDFFQFDSTKKADRTKSWLITFIPPLVMSVLAPMGFVTAIAYAGAVSTICGIIMPGFMAWKVRQREREAQNPADVFPAYKPNGYKVFGGNVVIAICILWGFAVAIIHLLAMFGMIPTFG
ncbi:aromatic amino acid transporter [Phocoenobacter skyensis]|nr:aromatic amino acid transporter [Pasteurella skyensis]MDP8079010.1 aromatic amino acid transporter [Pasteurella skyensis]MDP8084960.1 aromatic amino acid transporter [Pasteurella skyensis]MDP8185262.1 aromatic amino acid transporter [Pasteurella skyensis]QLB23459.1 transposase [Pasteurella skyensis]